MFLTVFRVTCISSATFDRTEMIDHGAVVVGDVIVGKWVYSKNRQDISRQVVDEKFNDFGQT